MNASASHQTVSAPSDKNRARMLEKVYTFWVKGVLENSLHGTPRLEPGMVVKAAAVAQPDRVLPPGTTICSVFDEMNGALLILGEPGAGKTTLLLELARDLIARAQTDDKLPIPVIFNLSSWAKERLPFADWLVAELNSTYQVPRKVGQDWVASDQVLTLLDGLDEVNADQRTACVDAINHYRSEHSLLAMVVCSRTADYEMLTGQLNLHDAVVLQPLTREQVNAHLASAGDGLAAVRTVLDSDAKLQELIASPLMLSMVTLAYNGLHVEDIPTSDTLEGRRKHIFNTYVQRMFARRSVDEQPTPEQMRHWLVWLAHGMSAHAQSIFHIEDLQPDWLAVPKPRLGYRLGTRAVKLAVAVFASVVVLLVAYTLIFRLTSVTESFVSVSPSSSVVLTSFMFSYSTPASTNPFYGLGSSMLFMDALLPIIIGLITCIAIAIGVTQIAARPSLRLSLGWVNWQRLRELLSGLIAGLVAGALGGWLLESIWNAAAGTPSPIGVGWGLTYGIIGGGVSVIVIWWLRWLIASLRYQRSSASRSDIRVVEPLGWSWSRALWGLLPGLILGPIIGVIAGFIWQQIWAQSLGLSVSSGSAISWDGVSAWGINIGLFCGLVGGLLNGLRRGLVRGEIDLHIQPNEGIWRTLRYATLVGLVSALLGGLAASAVQIYGIELSWGVIAGFILGMWFGGGDAVIKHSILRFRLWRAGYALLNYVRFLDDAASRNLLRKVGSGYSFTHRLLLNYFAELD